MRCIVLVFKSTDFIESRPFLTLRQCAWLKPAAALESQQDLAVDGSGWAGVFLLATAHAQSKLTAIENNHLISIQP